MEKYRIKTVIDKTIEVNDSVAVSEGSSDSMTYPQDGDFVVVTFLGDFCTTVSYAIYQSVVDDEFGSYVSYHASLNNLDGNDNDLHLDINSQDLYGDVRGLIYERWQWKRMDDLEVGKFKDILSRKGWKWNESRKKMQVTSRGNVQRDTEGEFTEESLKALEEKIVRLNGFGYRWAPQLEQFIKR